MGMFDQLNNFFNVGNTISQSANTQPDDVLRTKSALAQTGDYQVPDFGITDIPDMGMIDGLKKFQQNNGLKIDGVMKPNGPTEAKLGETMANQGITNNDLLEAAKPKPKANKIDPLTGLPEVKMPKLKKPTAKMWEQVAQQQKPKTAVIPEGKTVQQRIASMMQDKRYQDKQDTRLKDHISQQFKKAFPGEVSYDETGKMKQPTAAIMPENVEPFDPDGELKNITKNTLEEGNTEEPVSDDKTTQEQEGTDCASLKQDMDQAHQDWEDADEDYSGKFDLFQDQVEIADQAWDDLINTLTGAGISSENVPDKPDHDDEEKPKKNSFSWRFFKKLLERFLAAYEVGKYLNDVADAYWNYNSELKTLEDLRQISATAHETARKEWRTYSNLKKQYEQDCGG